MKLDQIDRLILNQLQRDCSLTNARLADLVGLSPPACLKRVKMLKRQGIIESEVALLNPKLAGISITMIVEVEMERDRSDLNQHFIRKVESCQEVTQCYQVTGEVDFVLIVHVESMEKFQDFAERILYAEPNMRKFRTLISMKRNKFSTQVPIENINI